ncbi:MAG: alpha/beta fold hydrolase [Anaerolineae bacterium]|nr:alpha/beta fold hydrolase [Anaerolineae bacterium]
MFFRLIYVFLALLAVSRPAAAQQAVGTFVPSPCPIPVPVGEDVDCGYLSVPQHHDDPNGPAFQLAVAILRTDSLAPKTDPVIYLSGGPGGSALASLSGWIDLPIANDRDLIFLDQRGTGYSLPGLFCENYEYDFDPDDLFFGEFLLYCRDEMAELGIDLGAFNSRESAWDVAVLIRALGLEQANLYGISYGTRLALTVMRDSPDVVRAAVLDSPYPLQINGFEAQVINGFSAIDALLAACGADIDCNNAFPSLSRRFYAFIESGRVVYANVGSGSEELRGYDIARYLFDVLYDSDAIPMVPMALSNILDGNAKLFGDLVSGYYATYEGGNEALEAFYDIVDTLAMRVLGMESVDFFIAYVDSLERNRRSMVYAQAISEATDEELAQIIQFYLDFETLEETHSYLAALSESDQDALIDSIVMALSFSYSNTTDSDAVFHTVMCTEEVPFNRIGNAEQNSLEVAATVREALLDGVYFQFELCKYWDVPAAPEIETQVVSSSIPVLILGGEFDPITPPVFAEAALQGLTQAQKVIIPGGGHGLVAASECPQSIGIAFLNDPTAALDTSCATNMRVVWETQQP